MRSGPRMSRVALDFPTPCVPATLPLENSTHSSTDALLSSPRTRPSPRSHVKTSSASEGALWLGLPASMLHSQAAQAPRLWSAVPLHGWYSRPKLLGPILPVKRLSPPIPFGPARGIAWTSLFLTSAPARPRRAVFRVFLRA